MVYLAHVTIFILISLRNLCTLSKAHINIWKHTEARSYTPKDIVVKETAYIKKLN